MSPTSCFSKASDDEEMFILLGRDEASEWAVRAWIDARIALGINKRDDDKIKSAEEWLRRAYIKR